MSDKVLIQTLLQTVQPDPIEVQRQAEARRRILARKRATDQLRPRSAEPVEGRKHIDVQTELYLEEIKGDLKLYQFNLGIGFCFIILLVLSLHRQCDEACRL